jgi:hypothetical protein
MTQMYNKKLGQHYNGQTDGRTDGRADRQTDKKGQRLNQMFIFSSFMLVGNFLFIFVRIMMHVLLCSAALYFFLINTPHLLC